MEGQIKPDYVMYCSPRLIRLATGPVTQRERLVNCVHSLVSYRPIVKYICFWLPCLLPYSRLQTVLSIFVIDWSIGLIQPPLVVQRFCCCSAYSVLMNEWTILCLLFSDAWQTMSGTIEDGMVYEGYGSFCKRRRRHPASMGQNFRTKLNNGHRSQTS